MIRKVKREWTKKEKAFHTVDAWGDKKLPEINCAIKQMDRDALKAKLKSLKLSEIGAKDVLVTRLKNHYKKLFLAERAGPNYQEKFISVEYFVALDFEATCIEENGPNYPHEIIEFPAVLVEVETGKTIAKFHSYVRPRINPLLSDFCTKLTGISQSQVDNAPYFPAVFKMFQEWLVENNLLVRYPNGLLRIEESTSSWTFVTGIDGSADICRFLNLQCHHDRIDFPYHWAGRYSNLKKIFQNGYKPKTKMKLEQMLEHLGLEFEGRLHSGIDDATNISRIAYLLIRDGHDLWQNEEFRKQTQYNLSPPKHIYDNIEQLKSINNKMDSVRLDSINKQFKNISVK